MLKVWDYQRFLWNRHIWHTSQILLSLYKSRSDCCHYTKTFLKLITTKPLHVQLHAVQPWKCIKYINNIYTSIWRIDYTFCTEDSRASTLFFAKKQGIVLVEMAVGQAMAALNFKSYWRAMEQSGADKNYTGGIPTSLGAQSTIQICRQMRLDLTIPNSLIWLPYLAGVAEC